MAGSSPAMTHRCVGLAFAERALEKSTAYHRRASPDRLDAMVWAISAMLSDRYWDGPRITQL
jgi:phage terminase large subunit-like protein